MKCQKCGTSNANTHIKTIVNGEFKEYDLCSECAKKMGYTNIFSDIDNEFSSFLGSFFGNSLPARTQATRCEFCGSTYSDIAKSGNVGCAKCYEIFGEQLLPSIRRIHGNTSHCGKNSSFAMKKAENGSKTEEKTEKSKQDKINELKKELENSIKEQNFERAAQLRDAIKEMEAE